MGPFLGYWIIMAAIYKKENKKRSGCDVQGATSRGRCSMILKDDLFRKERGEWAELVFESWRIVLFV